MKFILPTRMPTSLSRIANAVIVAVLFMSIGVGAGAWLFFGGIQKNLIHIQTAQGVVQAAESQQDLIRQSKEAVAREKDNIAQLEALFIPDTQDGIVTFVESLETVASSTLVTLGVTSPNKVIAPDGPYTQSFDITMSGQYGNVLNMIALLEQSGSLKRFDTLELSKSGDAYMARGTLVVATQ